MSYDEGERSVYAAVAVEAAPAAAAAVERLRSAVEDVLLPAVDASDLQLSLLVVRAGEDLSRERPVAGLVWDAVPLEEPLEVVLVRGTPSGGPQWAAPALSARAAFPSPRRRLDGSTGLSEAIIDCSVLRRAVREPLAELGERLTAWVLDTAEAVDADTGYLTVDFVQAAPGALSPYETAVMSPPAQRDVRREVFGYGWGTLLNAEHVARLGGPEVLDRAPVEAVRSLPGGRWWLQAGSTLDEVETVDHARLRQFLEPVLTVGTQPVGEHPGMPPLRV